MILKEFLALLKGVTSLDLGVTSVTNRSKTMTINYRRSFRPAEPPAGVPKTVQANMTLDERHMTALKVAAARLDCRWADLVRGLVYTYLRAVKVGLEPEVEPCPFRPASMSLQNMPVNQMLLLDADRREDGGPLVIEVDADGLEVDTQFEAIRKQLA